MEKITFDTNAFESNKPIDLSQAKLYISSIVLMELMAFCNDTKELKSYQKAYKEAGNAGILIVPDEQDYF